MKTLEEYKRGTKALKWIVIILLIVIIALFTWYKVLEQRKEKELYRNRCIDILPEQQAIEIINDKLKRIYGISKWCYCKRFICYCNGIQ